MALRLPERVVEHDPRVVLADDYAPTRIGLRAVLEAGGFSVCAEAADADGAVEAALREEPDLCLLDVRMPGGGLEAAARINAGLPGTPVVMVSASDDVDDVLGAMRAGAAGYVLKENEPEALLQALRAILQGEVTLPRRLLRGVVDKLEDLELRNRVLEAELELPLSGRERVVLDLLRQGLSTDEIARRLYVAPVTVRSHVSAILRKLGVADRQAAVELLSRSAAGA